MGMPKLTTAALSGLMLLSACSSESEDAQTAAGGGDGEDAAAEPAETIAYADLTGDPAAGERVFAQCQICHVLEPGVSRTGPSLHNIVGAPAGQAANFNYSLANAEADLVWTPETLFQFLEYPREVMPGTRMAFAGIRDPQDRADLVAYLESASVAD